MSQSSTHLTNTLDNIYLDISVTNNDSTSNYPLSYYDNSSGNYINRCSDYYVSMIRFTIPTRLMKIFTFRSDSYFVTLSYGGTDSTAEVPYISFSATDTDRNVFRYQDFITMINTAFKTAFDNLIAIIGVLPGLPTSPPELIYSNTGFISFFYPIGYDTDSVTPTINIYMSTKLHNFFADSIQIYHLGHNLPSKKDIQLLVQDYVTNRYYDPTTGVLTYYLTPQQINTLPIWYDFSGIAIITNSIPVAQTMQKTNKSRPASQQTSNNAAISSSIGNTSNIRAFVDFSIINSDPTKLTNLVYIPQGPYRLVDLLSDQALSSVDLSVMYINNDNTYTYFLLAPGDTAKFKLLFIKKSVYKGLETNYLKKL